MNKRKNIFFRLVGFECRKTFLNPWMVLFLIGLLIFNSWKLQSSYTEKIGKYAQYSAQYDQCYEAYGGRITAEKIAAFMTVYGPLEQKYEDRTLSTSFDPNALIYSEAEDEEFYRKLFYKELKYDYLYVNEAHAIASSAKALAQLYDARGDTCLAAQNRIIAEDFSGRSIPAFADTRGWDMLLQYDYSVMLVLLLTVFALCGSFVTERETDMHMLLRTTRNGCGRTVSAKLFTSAMFILVTCTLFFTQDFLTVCFSMEHTEALSSPVYAMRFFESGPLKDLTVGQYFLMAAGMKTLGVLGCGCIILLVSSLCRQVMTTFFTSFVLLMGGVVLQEGCRSFAAMKWFNPVELVMARELFVTDSFVNILGYPVRLWVFVTAGLCVTMAAVMAATLYCNRSYHNRLKWRKSHAKI